MIVLQLFLFVVLHTRTAVSERIKRSQQCAWSCSEGLQCKPRPYSPFSSVHCKNQPISGAVFRNVKLSNVLDCEDGKCSLQLQISASVNVTGNIRGFSVCADSAGMIGHCQIYTFEHEVARENSTARQANVNFGCFPVRPGQFLLVTLKTVPNYCTSVWTQTHLVPECSHKDIQNEIAECVTGRLTYAVDGFKNAISVNVTEAPEDTDYHLRLCVKRSFICEGEGRHRLIKPQDLQRSTTLHYSKALPCLCIEGWPAKVDAWRVQVCPFKNNLEELWSGITYDLSKQELIWEPLCPIKVSVSLCHTVKDQTCSDLGNVFHSEGHKVIFSSVDPHPLLCTKFSTDGKTWITCPFLNGKFPVWTTKMTSKDGQQWAEISTWIKANFSVSICEMKPQSSQCKQLDGNKSQTLPVEARKPRNFNLSAGVCRKCVCVQVQRVDVQFSVPVLQCDSQCEAWCHDQVESYSLYLKNIIMASVCFLTVLLAVVLVCKMSFKDTHKKKSVWRKPTFQETLG